MAMGDESIFSVKDCRVDTYSNPNQPILWKEKYGVHKQVLVAAIMDAENGPLVLHLLEGIQGHKGFDKHDMVEVLEKLREVMPEGPIALFWDNASIHTAKATR